MRSSAGLPEGRKPKSLGPGGRKLPFGYSDTVMVTVDLDHLLARLRWETDAGLSAFRNLDLLSGYECARMRIEAISAVLSKIDAAKDAASR